MQRPGSSSVSLAVMFAVITLIFVYLACIFTDFQLVFYFISTVFIMWACVEREPSVMLLFYIIVIVPVLLVVPDRMQLLPFVFFFGHYPIAKLLADSYAGKAGIVIKLAYFNVAMFLMYLLVPDMFYGYFPAELPHIAFIIIMEGVFLLYDLLLSKLTSWYSVKARARLKRSTY